MPTLLTPTFDLQDSQPAETIALDGAGVRGVRRMAVIDRGAHSLLTIDASVNLPAARMGAHMSRFHESFREAIAQQSVFTAGGGIESLAQLIATTVGERQDGTQTTVLIEGMVEDTSLTPATAAVSNEPIALLAQAQWTPAGVRSIVGVRVQGMNACPCAQGLVREQARKELGAAGFGADEISSILNIVPIATHNQRGIATLTIGSTFCSIDPFALAQVARSAMSAPIHELLKRSDELAIVADAHAHPRFVEDSVRAMLAGTLHELPALADSDIISATQRNLESIHAHDVEADRTALVGTVRAELVGAPSTHRTAQTTSIDSWLGNR